MRDPIPGQVGYQEIRALRAIPDPLERSRRAQALLEAITRARSQVTGVIESETAAHKRRRRITDAQTAAYLGISRMTLHRRRVAARRREKDDDGR